MELISRRNILIAAPAIILSKSAFAQRAKVISKPDPGNIFFQVPGLASTSPYTDITGKTLRSLDINPSEKTLIMICAGQSLQQSIITDTYSIVNPTKIDNFCWYDGSNYAATVPLLGTAWNGSIGSSFNYKFRTADGIISNGKFDRVIIINCHMSGTTVLLWEDEGAVTNAAVGYWQCIAAAALKLKARGITPSTPGVKFLIMWNQGESDTQQGTSQASYTASLNRLKQKIEAYIPGAKWTIATESWYIGATSSAVQAAQAAAVDNIQYFSGPNMDSINNSGRVGDQTHLNATGGTTAASLEVAAITAITF